ncbi:MAG: hypothetical protein LBT17_00050 [Mycoplasmataceae bacterium]|jgi:copper homeostasis protein|nr:hypothetical protein [Mycoplasmataceae bacterium]
MSLIREACVETKEQVDVALAHNAEQIELCSRLDVGGLTPDDDLLTYALNKSNNVLMMVRNEDSYFITPNNALTLVNVINKYVDTNVKGFVFGYLTKENKVDSATIKMFVDAAKDKETIFHMAFDSLQDPKAGIDELVKLGVTRTLTKGGSGVAINNLAKLKELQAYANGRIELIVGGSVTDDNYQRIASETGISKFHGRKLAYK